MCRFLVVLFGFCGLLQFSLADGTCRKVGDCSCEFYDGQGIDLSPVIPETSQALETTSSNADEFFFSPCKTIYYVPKENQTDELGRCNKGYTLCMYVNATKNYIRLGELDRTEFISRENDGLYLTYKNEKNFTEVKLVCARDKSSYLYLDPTSYNKTQNHTLILFSPWACPKTIEDFSKPSTGTVLLIMLFVSMLAYFLVGVTVNAVYLGARGMEMIPNLDFWRNLPGLVRDGARFLQNGCRVERRDPSPDTYDAI
uniref:Putative autophagy-related protein 27 n=2 Tax=Anopheles triannulatus TaxID=58253 RepID=A0A2M4AV13_9DIPT